MDVDTGCYTVVAASQGDPWGHFRFSRNPEVLEKEIHALPGHEAYQRVGGFHCGYQEKTPLDPPSSRGFYSILQTPRV